MDIDNDNPAAEDDLRAQLEAAFDAPEADEPATEATEASEDDGQPRDERGRWTKAQQEHFEEQQRQQQEQQEGQEQQQQQQQEEELRLAPPHGWSPTAKAAYASLPPEVQHAVAQRELEINKGFAKLRDYKGLEDAAEMARASGTTLKEAFDRYRAAEEALDQDFFGGTMQLCEMYGIHPVQLAQGILSQYGGADAQVPQMDPGMALLAQRLHATEETLRTLTEERVRQDQEAINGQIAAFANEAVYFEDVRRDMADLIRAGKADTLEAAYDMACWMNPEIRDLLIKEQAAPQNAQARVSQARRASGSLPTGAPAGSSTGSSANSVRAALEEAFNQHTI